MNIKNPKHAPINIVPNIVISFTPNIIPITVRHVIIIVVTLVESPSIPSVKLTAFVVANITTTANGIYSHIGRLIDVLKNGMYVSVPKCNIWVKYRLNPTDTINKPNILYLGFKPSVFLPVSFFKSSISPITPKPIVDAISGIKCIAIFCSSVLADLE